MNTNELHGLKIRLQALRARRDKAAAKLNLTEAERINAQVLRVKVLIESATRPIQHHSEG